EHRANYLLLLVFDRRSAVVDRGLPTALGDERRVIGQINRLALAKHFRQRILNRLAVILIDDLEYFRQMFALHLRLSPSGQASATGLRNRMLPCALVAITASPM